MSDAPERAPEGSGPSRRWISTPTTWVVCYAAVLVVVALLLTNPATLVVDGNSYFEMAREMPGRGTFEVSNGYELVNSRELWLGNTVRIDRRLWLEYGSPDQVVGARRACSCPTGWLVALLCFPPRRGQWTRNARLQA